MALLGNVPGQGIVGPAGTVSVWPELIVTLAKFRFTGGVTLQSVLAEIVRLPALPSPPKKLSCWQTTEPSSLMARIELPAGQVPVTRFCSPLIAVAVALKFWLTLAADAGGPVTNVFGTVVICAHPSREAHA